MGGLLGLVVVRLNIRVRDVLRLQFILHPLESLASRNVHGVLNLNLENLVGPATQVQAPGGCGCADCPSALAHSWGGR